MSKIRIAINRCCCIAVAYTATIVLPNQPAHSTITRHRHATRVAKVYSTSVSPYQPAHFIITRHKTCGIAVANHRTNTIFTY